MSKWDAAQVAFEIAQKVEEAYHNSEWLPRYQAAKDGGPPVPEAIEAEAERLTAARCAAEDVLIAIPAPNLPAAIWKIDYARPRWAGFEDWPADWWDSIMGDLRRLAA